MSEWNRLESVDLETAALAGWHVCVMALFVADSAADQFEKTYNGLVIAEHTPDAGVDARALGRQLHAAAYSLVLSTWRAHRCFAAWADETGLSGPHACAQLLASPGLKDVRDHLEHIEERLPGRPREKRAHVGSTWYVANFDNAVFGIGSSRVDLGKVAQSVKNAKAGLVWWVTNKLEVHKGT